MSSTGPSRISGFPPPAGILRKLLRIPHGLVLVTGPTGSGKTTTLNALLSEIVSDSIKVITIEDPVEFIVEGANQIQTNEQITSVRRHSETRSPSGPERHHGR
jgi:type II secretory ATPase GspE/PulE/Tfp pilus assembly ATPase PilB-like protein